MPTHHLVSTFSTVLKARCARRGPIAADPRTAVRAEDTGPAAAQLARPHGRMTEQGIPAARRTPRTALGPGGPQRPRLTHRTQPGRHDQDHTDLRQCPPRELARKSHPPGAPVSNRARPRSRARRRRVARDGASATLDRDLPRITQRLSEGSPRPGRCPGWNPGPALISAVFQHNPVGQKRQSHRNFVRARTIYLRRGPNSRLVSQHCCPAEVRKDEYGARHVYSDLAARYP